MKRLFFILTCFLALKAQAQENKGGSDVQSGSIEYKTLECYKAVNPEDATIVLGDSGTTEKEEKATSLNLTVKKEISYGTKLHHLQAASASMEFQTLAPVFRNKPGFDDSATTGRLARIDCDGGGWDVTLLNNGGMRISKVYAFGEVKSRPNDDGCGGTGYIRAEKPITLDRVTCQNP